ncbi:unnamed protein product, partial [Owenia fusiformis]
AHCNIFLLSEKAHANIIPQWRTFWSLYSSNPVFCECHVKVSVRLHHATSSQNSLDMGWVIRHGIAKMLKGLLVESTLVQKTETKNDSFTYPRYNSSHEILDVLIKMGISTLSGAGLKLPDQKNECTHTHQY